MKKLIITAFVATVATVTGAMAAQSHSYFAICAGHRGGWAGPARSTYAAAHVDELTHRRLFPGHITDVISY
jgi:hypothetical protein